MGPGQHALVLWVGILLTQERCKCLIERQRGTAFYVYKCMVEQVPSCSRGEVIGDKEMECREINEER